MDTEPTRYEDTSSRLWKVFISSTGFGLHGFRDAAREVIEGFRFSGLRCFEPVMMEDFGAEDGPAREVCVSKVRDCDIVVGIVGVRYGDHPPDDETSFTEIEFQAAVDYRVSRLMYLLNDEVAHGLEDTARQGEDRADRQDQFRARVAADLVTDMTVDSMEDFRAKLGRALEKWVRDYSFTRTMVDHSQEFRQSRERLLRAGQRTGGATLIYGAPGTGKTTLFNALLNDVPVQRAYSRLIGPFTVRLAEGKAAAEQVRADVSAKFDDIAGQLGVPRAVLPPVLVALYLESDTVGGKTVDADTLAVLSRLFTWDVPRTVVLAETNSLPVMERLERDLSGSLAVITVGDYHSVDDALEQMRHDAPDVREWPQPDTRILAEALGLRPISLFTAAKDIEAEARRSPRRVAARIRKQLEAIAREESEEGKYAALISNSIENLSPEARDLLALMTVLHPKPTLFPDEMAVALDLSLSLDEAIAIATVENDSTLSDDELRHRDDADDLVSELVDRGLLERMSGRGPAGQDSAPLLTVHPANVRAIRKCLPLTAENRAAGHARAEAFYRTLVGKAVSGSFEERFRMEDDAWWARAEEWIYHFGHIAPGRAGIVFAALFFDAYWWWDVYVPFDSCDRLLDYVGRPRVRAVSPDMSQIAALLTEFRRSLPRKHESIVARLYAQIAGGAPERAAGLRENARRGASVIPVLRELCACLGITELDALFGDAPPEPDDAGQPDDAPVTDQTRLHLLGLLCLFLAQGHWFRAELEPEGTALAAAESCYRRAESCFTEELDSYDVALTRNLLGQVISERGGDPGEIWEKAEEVADDESDTELLGNIERARAEHLRLHGDLDGALVHYGRAVFYGMAMQVTSNLAAGADPYTQAFYREVGLFATKVLIDPVLHDQGPSQDARLTEARRRLAVMLGEWGGSWEPDPVRVDQALREASQQDTEKFARAIADAAFPPGPGNAVLRKPGSGYYRQIHDLIEKTRSQPWVKGLRRWAKQRDNDASKQG
jgi:Domain of unknown function (DUF4062)